MPNPNASPEAESKPLASIRLSEITP